MGSAAPAVLLQSSACLCVCGGFRPGSPAGERDKAAPKSTTSIRRATAASPARGPRMHREVRGPSSARSSRTEAKGQNLVGLTPCGGESEKKRRQGEGGWKWFAMQICLAPTGSSPYKRKKRWVTFPPRRAQAVREPPNRRGPRLAPAPESPGGAFESFTRWQHPRRAERGGQGALPPRWMISR